MSVATSTHVELNDVEKDALRAMLSYYPEPISTDRIGLAILVTDSGYAADLLLDLKSKGLVRRMKSGGHVLTEAGLEEARLAQAYVPALEQIGRELSRVMESKPSFFERRWVRIAIWTVVGIMAAALIAYALMLGALSDPINDPGQTGLP